MLIAVGVADAISLMPPPLSMLRAAFADASPLRHDTPAAFASAVSDTLRCRCHCRATFEDDICLPLIFYAYLCLHCH